MRKSELQLLHRETNKNQFLSVNHFTSKDHLNSLNPMFDVYTVPAKRSCIHTFSTTYSIRIQVIQHLNGDVSITESVHPFIKAIGHDPIFFFPLTHLLLHLHTQLHGVWEWRNSASFIYIYSLQSSFHRI